MELFFQAQQHMSEIDLICMIEMIQLKTFSCDVKE
jgi:hypothetical protein